MLILQFPFYWMAITSFKPNAELMNYKAHNPFWISSPTLAHIKHLLFDTAYPHWLKTTMLVAIGSTTLSLVASTLRRSMPSSACASAAALCRARDLPRLSSCRRRSCSFRSPPSWCNSACRQSSCVDPGLSDLPGAVLHLAADRLFQVDPL